MPTPYFILILFCTRDNNLSLDFNLYCIKESLMGNDWNNVILVDALPL